MFFIRLEKVLLVKFIKAEEKEVGKL